MHPTSYESDGDRVYECVVCADRVETDSSPPECPSCGGPMRDLSVPRN